MLIGNLRVVVHDPNNILHLMQIVNGIIFACTALESERTGVRIEAMSASMDGVLEIEIRFVSSLQCEEVVAENGLCFLRNSKAPVGIIERNAKEPFDIDHRRNIVRHVKHIPCI